MIDNTNPGADTRAEYIALAKSHKIPCRCFVLNTPIELCHHLNYVRVHQTEGEVRRIPGKDPVLLESAADLSCRIARCGLQHVQKELSRTKDQRRSGRSDSY